MKKHPDDIPIAESGEPRGISLVWLVPIAAVIIAGWLVFDRVRNVGPAISITFPDGDGLQAGQTQIKYRGVKIGDVRAIHLSKDVKQVEVEARLDKSAKELAREGSLFWIVRPEVSAGGLHGLETIVSGAYIQVQPGNGKEQTKFAGRSHAPMMKPAAGSLEIIVTTPQLGSVSVGAPVYYRGIEVGSVEYYTLNQAANEIDVHLQIERRYASLVRQETKFWNAGGLNISLKFFGINVSAETAKSLLVGGIAFATPAPSGPAVQNGTAFPLYEKVEEKWLKWDTAIPNWMPPNSLQEDNP